MGEKKLLYFYTNVRNDLTFVKFSSRNIWLWIVIVLGRMRVTVCIYC